MSTPTSANANDRSSVHEKFVSGLAVGVASAYLFNPVDKALYLSVKENKRFLDSTLWRQPFKGVTKALYGRVISYGVYFSIFDAWKGAGLSNLSSALLTGSCVALACNPVNVVKMYHWNSDLATKSLLRFGLDMSKQFGFQALGYGLQYTISRDVCFSVAFYALHERYNPDKHFWKDVGIASMATVISSPINYCRNRLYFDFNKPVSFTVIMQELIAAIKAKDGTWAQKGKFVLVDRFCCGWGTARVGLGMAVSKHLYEQVNKALVDRHTP